MHFPRHHVIFTHILSPLTRGQWPPVEGDSMDEPNHSGRPSQFKEEYCQDIIDFCAKGYSLEAYAGKLGICKQTLYTWFDKYPQFLDAKSVALQKSRMFWEGLAIDHVVNKSDYFGEGQSSSRSLNASVWIFNMKNRFKWRDKTDEEIQAETVVRLAFDPSNLKKPE